MKKLIKLIKEEVLKERMTIDETIKYILELKEEIAVLSANRKQEEKK